MADDLSRDWCEHCQQYVKKRTKRLHSSKFYNPVTKVWKKSHYDHVHSISESEFQFSSDDDADVDLLTDVNDYPMQTERTTNEDLEMRYLSSSEGDDSSEDEALSTTNSESSTDISDYEDWLDADRNEILRQLQEKESMPIFQTNKGEKLGVAKTFVACLLVFFSSFKSVFLISSKAIEILLGFFKLFLGELGIYGAVIAEMAGLIPTTIYKLHQMLGINRNDFERFIVCQKCLKLHGINLCNLDVREDRLLCDNVPFQKGKYGKRCNARLVREVYLKNGDKKHFPIKMYCFKSLVNTLEDFLCRPGFEDSTETWRSLPTTTLLADVFDGQVWHDFQNVNGIPFLSESHNFAFMLNVDWFQPYERRHDISVGVLYMVCLNLPRKLRYKRENVFLVSIIPNLKKEPKSLNSFLQPLVKEFKSLWKGITLRTNKFPNGHKIRAAILCAAADIPAARKLCGFLGHSASLGCSKCLKRFNSAFGESTNYGGFDRALWTKRTHTQHMSAANRLKTAKTKTARENLERKFGYRYSQLLDLDYMDCVRLCIIDPMHNLFLGTAKHVWKVWIESKVLSEHDIEAIEDRIDKLKFPSDVGRLPTSISSNWGGYTAQQWKTWILTVSLYALTGILPEQDMKVWHTFVRACQKICNPVISKTEAKIADSLFLKFGKEFESLYGSSRVTPNIHLHCHLLDVILDFGSIYGFWLFSFERYNGLLGNFPNNNRDIEIQLMREFLTQDQLNSLIATLPVEIKNAVNLDEWINKCKKIKPMNSYLDADQISDHRVKFRTNSGGEIWTNFDSVVVTHSSKSLKSLDEDDIELLTQAYQVMYNDRDIGSHQLSVTYHKINSIRFGNEFLSSKTDSQSSRSKFLMASWMNSDRKASPNSDIRPCTVKHYMEHTINIDGNNLSHIFAVVDWYRKCDKCDENCYKYPSPVSVWLQNKYERAGSATFLPIQRYVSKFVFGPCYGHENDHMAVTPMNSSYTMV